MIDPRLLKTFCSLVDIGHFTRTAEQLFMTQSGVSQHIRKLEDQLQTRLLIRDARQFILTDAGQRLYRQGKSLLADMEHLAASVIDDPEYQGEVRVMSPGSVGLKLYPQLLIQQSQHPGLSIDYRFAPNREIEQAIAQRRIDLGFTSQPPHHEDVKSQPVAEEPLLLVIPKQADYAAVPQWQTLCDLGFIGHPDAEHHAGLLLQANYSSFEHVEQFIRRGFSNQISLILQPVSLGLGFTVLPSYAVEAFSEQDKIATFALNQPVSETLYQIEHRQSPLPKRVQTVATEIRQILSASALNVPR
ncbi:LysR family transcriptional regulator [Oceanospirillum linum]|uniref:LysR family transcriptional regulator n=1 Tax=Oceanospirillum linum TaxID=966 RepID=A0A1T1H7X1_OCELI|nr:LysR family transcriptional regulator [Oceanospirillum linum]OOV85964.1 LysR family transcriptional regulator [Oceanospirillum linum]SEG44887.1 DNA-binding transcriptional regulator, LysR family [Oleiphilus messinensis]SMP34416.1 transcriptional regulator, LysR family [Oceanospirillum linum]